MANAQVMAGFSAVMEEVARRQNTPARRRALDKWWNKEMAQDAMIHHYAKIETTNFKVGDKVVSLPRDEKTGAHGCACHAYSLIGVITNIRYDVGVYRRCDITVDWTPNRRGKKPHWMEVVNNCDIAKLTPAIQKKVEAGGAV